MRRPRGWRGKNVIYYLESQVSIWLFTSFVWNGLAALDMIQSFANRREKFHPLGNGVKTRVFWKTLNRVQRKLLVAHEPNVSEKGQNCKGCGAKAEL